MQVLHIFDRYLNTTMNWAHNFMRSLPEVQHIATAPIRFENAFDRGVQLLTAPHQHVLPMPRDEWSVPVYYRGFDKLLPGVYEGWLKRYVMKHPPDIIHTHFGGVGVRHMKWIKHTGIPFITSFYGFDMEKLPYKKPEYRAYYRTLADTVTAVLVLGTSSKRTLAEQYGFQRERIWVHPLGIDVKSLPFHTRKKPSTGLRLLQIATLTPKKGQLDALKALRRALSVYPDIRLTFVGERWDKSYVRTIEEYIDNHGLHHAVNMLPFVAHDEIYQLMEQYDAFIHPSHYTEDRDSEGGATFAILEAMASGLPVLSTAHRSIPERVIDGEMGFIVPERDIEALSKAIVRMYEMPPHEYQKMSRACRNQIEMNFDSIRLAKKMESIYNTVMRQHC